jgi:tripartite ATP-independent transporter DctM subunit
MDWLPVSILALAFFLLVALGVPVAIAIGLATTLTMVLSIPALPAVTTVAQVMATGIDSFALLAIPFFILAGEFMSRGGIARRLVDFAKAVVGGMPGGLAYVNIIAAMLFGSISGSATAAASAIGTVMGPRMVSDGYDRNFAAAVNLSSATTGLIIPPSNILIIYSLASGGISITALFLAGYLPGILIGLALMAVAGLISYRRNYPVPDRLPARIVLRHLLDALPSLFLLVIVIGGIVAGVFTPTEAAAVAVLYTFILSVVVYREVHWRELPKLLLASAVTTSVVMLLIGTSMAMSWFMAYANIPQFVSSFFLGFTDSPLLVLLMINVLLLMVGIFMDMAPAVLIFTPIFLPVIAKLGIDPVHFGIIMVMNLSIGLCTPPVGTVLFVGCSVSGTTITGVIRPLLPLFAAMIVALLVVTCFPQLCLALPRFFGF